MTENEKIQMLLAMQEHPENYSEQALEAMLNDPEVRALMEATALLKQAVTWEAAKENAVNVDTEWQRFAGQHLAGSKPRRSWLKAAAVFLAVLCVSGITFAAIHMVRMASSRKPQTVQTEQPVPAKPSVTLTADTLRNDTIVPRVIRYDEATLEKILTDMADYYRLRISWKKEEAKSMRLFFQWDQHLKPQDVMEQLNMFDRIHLALSDSTITAE